MPASSRLPLLLGAAALLLSIAGVLVPRGAPAPAPAPAPADACTGTPFEMVLFGDSLDDQRLPGNAPPASVYRVPPGVELCITDIDATSGGLVLWRRAAQRLVQVGFVVDRAAVGLGQSSRSYVSGIRFEPGDEVLVGSAGQDVEWAVLRGTVTPLGQAAERP